MSIQAIYKILVILVFSLFVFVIILFFVSGIRINEIMYDLNGSDAGREWVEVYNDGSESLNLTAWKFYEDNQKHNLNLISGSWVIGGGGYFVIADNSATFLQDNPSYAGTLFDSSFSLLNTGESLALWNGSEYFSNTTYSSSSGANGDGKSLQLIDSVWQSCLPTPGSANSCQSQQSQNQTNQTQQNETQNNQTQQNQTNQTSQNQTTQTSKNITLNYPYNASFSKNISVELYAYNLDDATYDVKLAVYDGGSIVSETYNENEAKWKSSTYYINGVFYGAYIKKNFTLRINDNDFEGEANISVKLRKSGTNSAYIEYSGRINILKTEKAYKSNESIIIINPDEDAEEDKSSNEEDTGVIRLNNAESKTEKGSGMGLKAETGSVIFMSQTEKIKKYAIYGFAVFLIALIIILLKYRRI
ncbi:lamin tail domain-containing protein [Candidatus Pacearchaeota archaeon]|nr:lamin tail domain-containing protein [Candidatus Pacearchaeota archaeon]